MLFVFLWFFFSFSRAAEPRKIDCQTLVSWDPSVRNESCRSLCLLGAPIPVACREEIVLINGASAALQGECFENWKVGYADYTNADLSGSAHGTYTAVDCQTACQSKWECVYFMWEVGMPNNTRNCLLKLESQMWNAIEEDIDQGKPNYCPEEVVKECEQDSSACLSCHKDTLSCVQKKDKFVSGPAWCSMKHHMCLWGPTTTTPPPTTVTTPVESERSQGFVVIAAAGGAVTLAIGAKALANLIRRDRTTEAERPHTSPSDATCQTITEESYI